jgi:hypothetical protein
MTVISCSHYGHAFSFLQATKHKSSIVFWKEHRCDRSLAFPADVAVMTQIVLCPGAL